MHETTNRRSLQLDPDRLRLERQRQALTQEELAHRAGITRLAVSQLERGLVQPRIPTLRKLADALGIKPASLLVNEGNS
jgi:transcriptional regulator with XRE-family HTH domain